MHVAIAKMAIIKTLNANLIKFPTFSEFDKDTQIRIKNATISHVAIKMRDVFMNLCFFFYESLFCATCKIKKYSRFKNAIF